MRLILPVLTAMLLLVAVACSGPSDEEVEAKAHEVLGRAVPLVLAVGFAFSNECTQLVDDLTAKMGVELHPEPPAALIESGGDVPAGHDLDAASEVHLAKQTQFSNASMPLAPFGATGSPFFYPSVGFVLGSRCA